MWWNHILDNNNIIKSTDKIQISDAESLQLLFNCQFFWVTVAIWICPLLVSVLEHNILLMPDHITVILFSLDKLMHHVQITLLYIYIIYLYQLIMYKLNQGMLSLPLNLRILNAPNLSSNLSSNLYILLQFRYLEFYVYFNYVYLSFVFLGDTISGELEL